MRNKKILTIQDISCYGQCSTTVALPILSAFGYETVILPSAILSTHTAGFKGFTVHDLSPEMPKIIEHWEKENIKFDVLYSAYLGEINHMDYVLEINNNLMNKDSIFLVDPVMGDNGKLYPAFNLDYVEAMKRLVEKADIIIPNLTEATFLTGIKYKEISDEAYIDSIIYKLKELGAKNVIITGVPYSKDKIGIVSLDSSNNKNVYIHDRVYPSYHGTGDIYTSVFLASYLNKKDLVLASKEAADFVVRAIKNTIGDDTHNYGVKYEPILSAYVEEVK